MIEKPFGHDLESARALNAELCEVLEEEQILRIDHYLGKEPVMDITYLRFANSMLEPVWNREHVSHVQMTIAEDFGVDDRGRFYDAVGAMRDVIQNHALQVLALVGMGPPTGNHHDSIRDKKLEFFKAMRTADPKRYVRGQYEGFLDVKDVAPDSTTETFAAVELEVDNWRWSGVPFFIRAGKCMPAKASEVSVVFKRPPPLGVGPGKQPEPNQMTVRIEPTPGVAHAPLRQAGRRGGVRAGRPRGPIREGARARSPSPTSGCSATRSPAATSSSPARTRSRRPGASCSRCSTSPGRCTPTSRAPGGRPRRRSSPAASASGTSPGCPGSDPSGFAIQLLLPPLGALLVELCLNLRLLGALLGDRRLGATALGALAMVLGVVVSRLGLGTAELAASAGLAGHRNQNREDDQGDYDYGDDRKSQHLSSFNSGVDQIPGCDGSKQLPDPKSPALTHTRVHRRA